jgi:undecaprenyl diphosphate synthase
MDGNGRWAKNRGLPRTAGHAAGSKKFKEIARYCNKIGIKYLTVYAFSTENWKRPQEEVDAIMQLFREYLIEAEDRKAENEEKGISLRFIGDRKGMPQDILALMEHTEKESSNKNNVILNIAVNYGGRHEICEGIKEIAQKVKNGEIDPQDITEEMISGSLYTKDIPDPDLIIRPSGEYRTSNFLTWQSAYAELYFTDVLWPDFTEEDVNKILEDYQKRNRRFGGV